MFSSRQTLLCSPLGFHAHNTWNGVECLWIMINYHLSLSNPLTIHIQTTSESELAQLTFNVNLLNVHSTWMQIFELMQI